MQICSTDINRKRIANWCWKATVILKSLWLFYGKMKQKVSDNYIADYNGQQLYFRSPTRPACGKENFQLFRLESAELFVCACS